MSSFWFCVVFDKICFRIMVCYCCKTSYSEVGRQMVVTGQKSKIKIFTDCSCCFSYNVTFFFKSPVNHTYSFIFISNPGTSNVSFKYSRSQNILFNLKILRKLHLRPFLFLFITDLKNIQFKFLKLTCSRGVFHFLRSASDL